MINASFDRIALISAPWPFYSRPSIQLGALKAYIVSRIKGLCVDAHHMYLIVAKELGFETYSAISDKTWPAECVYAALLYPAKRDEIKRLFRKISGSKLKHNDLSELSNKVGNITDAWIDGIDWQSYGAVGFTVNFAQMSSSLYIMKKIKEKNSDICVIAGGGGLPFFSSQKAFKAFPEIDFAVYGEGEKPLFNLISNFRNNDFTTPVKGVVSRREPLSEKSGRRGFDQIRFMDELPYPDYSDYFALHSLLKSEPGFFPALPMEISRGCWRRRACNGNDKNGCAFCNLNLQWEGYRSKTPGRAAIEADELTNRHKVLSVYFTDNLIPLKDGGNVMGELMGINKDLQLFCEIRPTTSITFIRKLKSAGTTRVQVGIESLSTSLLKKMNKGTSAIQNIEIMRDLEAYGIENDSNLIVYFPGSTDEEADETLRAIDYAIYFRPLRVSRFFLGSESPICINYRDYGISSVFNHHYYKSLYPEHIVRNVGFPIKAYRGDRKTQMKRWKKVIDKVDEWEMFYAAMKGNEKGPGLTYRDGGNFIIIRQIHPFRSAEFHRLVGTSRAIYLFCMKNKPLERICRKFPGFTTEKIENFLHMMCGKKLMFQEKDRFLSLASPSAASFL